MTKFARHKYHIGIKALIDLRREHGNDSIAFGFARYNTNGSVIKKMAIIPLNTRARKINGSFVFDAIALRPVDKLDYPKFILGLA